MKIAKASSWIPVLIWMSVIFFFSSQPALKTVQIDWQDFIIRKTAHFIEYFILFTLNYRAFLRSSSLSKQQAILLSLCLGVLYAATDEYHQTFVSGREGRLRDVFIDTLGLSASAVVFLRNSSKSKTR
jgi:VanZ family protein